MLRRLIDTARLLTAGPAAVRGAVTVGTALATVVADRLPSPDQVITAAAERIERVAAAATQAPARAAEVADSVRHSGRALLDLHPERARRRVWAGHGHAQIEVRGMTGSGSRHRRVAASVTDRLRRLRGVRWAEVNAVTGQVLVAFEEGRVNVGGLLETVRGVEEAQGTREENFSWSRPVHPSDPTPVAAATVELAADCLSVATALGARMMRLPRVPRALRVAQALLELEPPVRRRLKHRIGPINTDVVLALSAAAIQGLSQGPSGPAVDALYRMELLAEAVTRRTVWEQREPDLCCTHWTLPNEAPERPPRPVPRPDGPIETWANELGPGALLAAGTVLGLTRDPGRAAETILVAVPRAARLGREGFAASVGRELARHGVVPLNAAAWRRLDRISAIIVDAPLLCTDRPQILTAEAAPGADLATVWRQANAVLHGRSMHDLGGTGPWERGEVRLSQPGRLDEPGAVRLVLRQGNRLLGRVQVGHELAPLADTLLDAARATGARVLLTRHASVADLVPRADEVLDNGRPLAEHVQRLQRDGHGVLVVSQTNDQALAVADVGVAVFGGDACVCWSADVLCGPGLEDLWRILRATAAARPVSRRAVQLAQAGSALGGLLALVGDRDRGRTRALAPVHGAAAVALLLGTAAGLSAARARLPALVTHVPWHALEALDVLARLDAARAEEAPHPEPAPLREAGRLIPAPARVLLRFAGAIGEELKDPLTPVLAVGAAASAIVGSGIDSVLVAAVMTGNAVVSGTQRVLAERALRRLFLEQESVARRLQPSRQDGDTARTFAGLDTVPLEMVPARRLSPGDIIALRAADVVPADARLLSATDLEVDESTLTGESVPAEKSVEATPGVPLAERSCLVFEGTTVLAGTAYAVVVATGEATEAGRATRVAGKATAPGGLQAQLAEVTRTALPATGIGGAAVTGLGMLRGLPLRQAVAAGVSVAVAAVPEGLPLVATVAQAAAARRLSRQGVLVRSSRTLEALGRIDVVCFDKTGTLTKGRLSVARLASPDGTDPDGNQLLLTAARACPRVAAENIRKVPHATDRAVLEAARALPDGGWHLHTELPFETNRGYAAAVGEIDGAYVLAVKGAPEVILPRCTGIPADRRRALDRTVERLAGDGLRVLAVAERRDGALAGTGVGDEAVADLTLLGFVGVADTPRPDAVHALRRLTGDGIRMVMVTGDHPTTAAAVARMVGMPADTVLTGAELDKMPEGERVRRVAETSVFARVSPEQKLRIVEALQAAGLVVAMTGDGTNDAAAIRLADVGIGVATSESSAARTAADLVLADAGVERIYDALLEGRTLWRQVRDAVSILVGGNAGEVAFMVLGTALGGRAPIGVRQMLLVNMFTDMFPALAVAVAPSRGGDEEAGAPTRFDATLARTIAVRGGATALGALLAWTIGRYTGRQRRASTMGLAALVGTQLGQTLITGWHSPLVVATSLASAAVLVGVIELPGVSHFFGCTPIGPVAWGVVIGSAAAGTAIAVAAPRWLPQVTPPPAAADRHGRGIEAVEAPAYDAKLRRQPADQDGKSP